MSAVKKLRDKWLAAWEDGFDVGNMETILFKLGEAIEADAEGAVEVALIGNRVHTHPKRATHLLVPLPEETE